MAFGKVGESEFTRIAPPKPAASRSTTPLSRARAEIALALHGQMKTFRQQAAQLRFGAGRRVEGAGRNAAVLRQRLDRLRQVADKAARDRGAFVRPKRRRQARLGRAGGGGLANDRNGNGLHRDPAKRHETRVLFIGDWQVSTGSQSLRRHRRLECLNKSATPDSKCILFYINRVLRPPFKLSDNSVRRAARRNLDGR